MLCNKVCKKFNKQIDFLIIEHDENKKENEITKTKLAKNITKYNLYTKSYDEKGAITTMGREEFCSKLFKNYVLKKSVKENFLDFIRIIFSIRKEYCGNICRKVITLLGIKIKLPEKCIVKPKVLIHIHVYYHNQVDFIIKKLKNINNVEQTLYVTYVDYNQNTINKFKKFDKNTNFIQVNNIGYDVLPFIKVLQSVNLENYSYILKLHTKNYQPIGPEDFVGYQCRNTCFNALLKDKKQFLKCIKLLSNNDVGMVGTEKYLLNLNKESQDKIPLHYKMCRKLDLKNDYGHCIGGTMFMCKANLMEIIKMANLKETDFSPSLKTGDRNTLAHILEGIFGLIVENQGYKVVGMKLKNHTIKTIFSITNSIDKKHKVIRIIGIKIKIKIKN